MSALIDTEIDTVYTPAGGRWENTWHGLQTPVEGRIANDGSNIPLVLCPVVQCGVKPDLEGELCTVQPDDNEELSADLTKWKLIVADCRKGKCGKFVPLHIPKKGYTVHQNSDLYLAMVGAATQVLGENGFDVVSAGTLGSYSQFFLSIVIKGKESFEVGTLANGAKDTFEVFFNLNSAHNGLIGSNRMLSAVRIVCFNTVQMSISDAEQGGNISVIKHTLNSGDRITAEEFAKDLEKWVTRNEKFQNALRAIKSVPMNLDGFRAFASGVFTNDGSDTLSNISYNRVEEMAALFNKGKGNTGESVYDAINAFTEFFTSGNGAGSKTVKLNKRVANANFGRGNDWKQSAIEMAVDEKTFAKTIERGTKLYQDKLIAIASR